MPATDSAMASPMGGQSGMSGAPDSKTANGWAGATILGFLAFGLTAILFGLSVLPSPYSKGFAAFLNPGGLPAVNGVTDVAFGAAVLVVLGIIGILKSHPYWGAAFFGYGVFWYSWAGTGQGLTLVVAGHLTGTVAGFSIAALAFIWLLFTLTFLISAPKHGWGAVFSFGFLLIGLILLIIEGWTLGGGHAISSGLAWATGGFWIFIGLVWWLHGTAELTNHAYNKKVIPF